MKKIVLTLAAIAALSTAAFARSDRDGGRDPFASIAGTSKVVVEAAPLAIKSGHLSAYERTMLTTQRDEGRGNR
jgi:predicted outer membrane protein